MSRTLRGRVLWRIRRREALERDGYRCQRCDATPPTELHVHHIRKCREFGDHQIEEAHALDNLITLCERCHPVVEAESAA